MRTSLSSITRGERPSDTTHPPKASCSTTPARVPWAHYTKPHAVRDSPHHRHHCRSSGLRGRGRPCPPARLQQSPQDRRPLPARPPLHHLLGSAGVGPWARHRLGQDPALPGGEPLDPGGTGQRFGPDPRAEAGGPAASGLGDRLRLRPTRAGTCLLRRARGSLSPRRPPAVHGASYPGDALSVSLHRPHATPERGRSSTR